MILLFEKMVRFLFIVLSISNQYVMFFWILAAIASLLGFIYTISSVSKVHKRIYAVRMLTGFALMLGIVGFTVYLSSMNLNNQSKAMEEISPYDIKLVRIGPDAASISWSTRVPTRAYVVYHLDASSGLIAVTDQGLRLSSYHSVKLENLKTNTIYRYSIIVNGREFSVLKGSPFKFVFP